MFLSRRISYINLYNTVFINLTFLLWLENCSTWMPTANISIEFPDGWLPSNHSTYGVCERKHAISNTPKEKKNQTLKDRESEGATARLRNGKWGARETRFEQWSLTRFLCALWHHLVETTHWHSLFFFSAVPPATGRPTEYDPFKRYQVPVGHPV